MSFQGDILDSVGNDKELQLERICLLLDKVHCEQQLMNQRLDIIETKAEKNKFNLPDPHENQHGDVLGLNVSSVSVSQPSQTVVTSSPSQTIPVTVPGQSGLNHSVHTNAASFQLQAQQVPVVPVYHQVVSHPGSVPTTYPWVHSFPRQVPNLAQGLAADPQSHPQFDENFYVQQQFLGIKDSVQRVILNPTYRLTCDSRWQPKQEDKALSACIKASAKYVETNLKLLSQIQEDIEACPDNALKEKLSYLFVCNKAHINYLQKKYSVAILRKKLRKEASELFEVLEDNPVLFPPASLQNVEVATRLAANLPPPENNSNRGGWGWRRNNRGGQPAGRGYRDRFSRDFRGVPVGRSQPMQAGQSVARGPDQE